MSADDFDVVVYKALAYIMACAKAGVVPSVSKAQEVAGCNDVYWAMAVRSMLADGYIMGATVDCYMSGKADIHAGADFGITQRGAALLKDDPRMKAARSFLGAAVGELLSIAVEATKALMA